MHLLLSHKFIVLLKMPNFQRIHLSMLSRSSLAPLAFLLLHSPFLALFIEAKATVLVTLDSETSVSMIVTVFLIKYPVCSAVLWGIHACSFQGRQINYDFQ